MSRSIRELGKGDFVKTGSGLKEVASVWGVDPGGRLAKPSEGGFGVVTTDGQRVGMFEALSYLKKEDLPRAK